MVTKEDLQAKYAGLSNEALLEILERKADYTELAVETVTEEIKRRNLTPADYQAVQDQKDEKVKANYANAIVDLPIWQKLLFYIPIGGFMRRAYKMNFREDGSMLKIKQSTYFAYAGWAAILVVLIGAIAFHAGDAIRITIWIICFIPVYLYNQSFYKPKQLIKINQQFGV